MRSLADLRRHDVDVDREQSSLPDRYHDGVDHGLAVAPWHRVHGILHHVRAALVDLLELEGIQRCLVVITCPDVMDAAATFDQEFVDIGSRTPNVSIGRTRIALLMASEPNNAATRTADVAGRKRQVYDGAVGAVIVVAPDDSLLVAEHRASAFAAGFWFGNPLGCFDDIVGLEPGNLNRIVDRRPVRGQGRVEVGERLIVRCTTRPRDQCRTLLGRQRAGRDERLVGPSLVGDVSQQAR